jgi:hypothetical protein
MAPHMLARFAARTQPLDIYGCVCSRTPTHVHITSYMHHTTSRHGRALLTLINSEALGGEPTSDRGLTVTELLVRVGHYSEQSRKDGLAGLRTLFTRHPTALEHTSTLMRLFEKVAPRIHDDAAAVRHEVIAPPRYVRLTHVPFILESAWFAARLQNAVRGLPGHRVQQILNILACDEGAHRLLKTCHTHHNILSHPLSCIAQMFSTVPSATRACGAVAADAIIVSTCAKTTEFLMATCVASR